MTNDLDDRLHATENTWIIAWGVRDSHDRVTEYACEQDARAYQAMHGGKVVKRRQGRLAMVPLSEQVCQGTR
jgi:hypothetical protein